jgi:8-oxo-dGTP pyrophosphatase MutT (NUDIX family)
VIDRFRVVPASYVFFLRTSGARPQVLLQLRRGTGYRDGHWAAAAAGHVEAGESAVRAACREAAEELGVTVEPADLEPVTAMHRTHGNGDPIDERVDFFFGCRRWLGDPRVVEPDKSAELAWFDLQALPDPVVPHELFVLRGLLAGDLPPVVTFGFADPPR